MCDFRNYLVIKHFTSKKESHFYAVWVENLYEFIGKKPDSDVKQDEINFLYPVNIRLTH